MATARAAIQLTTKGIPKLHTPAGSSGCILAVDNSSRPYTRQRDKHVLPYALPARFTNFDCCCVLNTPSCSRADHMPACLSAPVFAKPHKTLPRNCKTAEPGSWHEAVGLRAGSSSGRSDSQPATWPEGDCGTTGGG
jgi:hypothetical protein